MNLFPERVLTRAQLRDKVWGYPHDLDDHSVDPHVQRLRRKLSDLANPGVSLEAVPGVSAVEGRPQAARPGYVKKLQSDYNIKVIK